MDYEHVPVMADEVTEGLGIKAEGVYADGTLGGGGHAARICEKLAGDAVFIGIDRDSEAIAASEARLAGYRCEKIFVRSEFADIKAVLAGNGISGLDGALLDLGVSSRQLDTPERGFSYMSDAPLDMRMGTDGMFTAYDVVNGYTKEELARIIKEYGEERWAGRIAAFIVKERARRPIETTHELVDVIKAAIPASARREGPHPAKRTFQAIRIEVNDELGQIERAADDFVDALNPGGRMAVITFHSLEDRIVKDAFKRRENPCTCPPDIPVCVCGKTPDARRVNRKPILPCAEEVASNPRARSAKLRIIEKLR
ncbi:MAG: 16S rRNA (cytosine(1402)-N(4))-methyltransferase RsmH [Clostridiales Family XIII bacterium]|jgi:16S rRNA (cytosine1402-N4)-methyltransferase|nr:16S rRNA (cytosine(1402)-N(4))-methyltransferase RsmH [Clostridiales Family XIII bacterium]